MIYNVVFEELESYMTDRASISDQLRFCIHNYMRVARNEAIKSFDAIMSYCIRRVVDLAYVINIILMLLNIIFLLIGITTKIKKVWWKCI